MIDPLPRVAVLLVDDRADSLLALEAVLEPLGHKLVRAMSGRDAVAAVEKEQFAVILLDVNMPGLDGFETLAMIRQNELAAQVPIIFLSAFAEGIHLMRSYELGAADYISKPIDPHALRSKVEVFAKLRQSQLAFEQARLALEVRVAERTRELLDANRALENEVIHRKAAEQRLYDRAYRDDLTGLANRPLFLMQLGRAMARARRRPQPTFAVLVLDADGLKSVNDSLGHLVGDRLLADLGERLSSCVRDTDTVARLGGDEFAVLLDGIERPEDAVVFAERITLAMRAPFSAGGHALSASASIGIAVMSARYSRAEDLLRDADMAMYRAKQAGGGRYEIFDERMREKVVALLGLEAQLRRALDQQAFRLLYQPVIELATSELVGFEGLVRWIHPRRGELAPASFLSAAEDAGLALRIGRSVMAEARERLDEWRRIVPDVMMSLNVSRRELAHPELVPTLESVLLRDRSGIPSGLLELEITEKALASLGGTAKSIVERIASLGVGIRVDSFGVGPTRLRDLFALPIAGIKLACPQPAEASFFHGVIAFCHALGKTVVAKNVETQGQLELAREVGCDFAQGFAIATPLASTAVRALLHGRLLVQAGRLRGSA